MKRLGFTRSAVGDLERLRAFIAEKNPQAAERISRLLRNTIRYLIDHPELGRELDELRDVRELIARDYVVHYRTDGEAVTILRVWHGKEDRCPPVAER